MSSIGRVSGGTPVPDPTPPDPAPSSTPAATPAVSRTPAPSGRPPIGVPGALRRAPATDSASAVRPSGRAPAPGRRAVTFVFDAGPHGEIKNPALKGTFNPQTGAFDPSWSGDATTPMRPLGNGKWAATVNLLDDGAPHDWRWGVVADGPSGKGQWAVMGEEPLKLDLASGAKEVTYSPTTYHTMGAERGTTSPSASGRRTRRT